MDESQQIVKSHYDENPKKEWDRLKRYPFEFPITVSFIEKYINPGCTIFDIGGGPGRYSLYFAEKGYQVSLLDLSYENIRFAKKKMLQYKVKFPAIAGDACELPYSDSSADAVLLFGPLYHILDENLRKKALKEATRILRPGGFLFASFINLSGGMVFEMREFPELILSEDDQRLFYLCLNGKRPFRGRGFTDAVFDTPESLSSLMDDESLEKVEIFGQESVLAPCQDRIKKCSPKAREAWLKEAILLASREEFFSFSEHLCYIAKKK